jgi:mannose-6-phosphate isomerase-like protein (cupin superfamily)
MQPEDWRSWGYFEVLTEALGYKVRKIVIQSGKRISLQLYLKRHEHWIVVAGFGKVTRGQEQICVTPSVYVYLPSGSKHHIENIGKEPLVLIEVQQGEYIENNNDDMHIENNSERT